MGSLEYFLKTGVVRVIIFPFVSLTSFFSFFSFVALGDTLFFYAAFYYVFLIGCGGAKVLDEV